MQTRSPVIDQMSITHYLYLTSEGITAATMTSSTDSPKKKATTTMNNEPDKAVGESETKSILLPRLPIFEI